MATVGRYCLMFRVRELRTFPGWRPNLQNFRSRIAADHDVPDDYVLYLHDSLIVTDGIHCDEHVVYADASPEWERFCREVLAFEVPERVVRPTVRRGRPDRHRVPRLLDRS